MLQSLLRILFRKERPARDLYAVELPTCLDNSDDFGQAIEALNEACMPLTSPESIDELLQTTLEIGLYDHPGRQLDRLLSQLHRKNGASDWSRLIDGWWHILLTEDLCEVGMRRIRHLGPDSRQVFTLSEHNLSFVRGLIRIVLQHRGERALPAVWRLLRTSNRVIEPYGPAAPQVKSICLQAITRQGYLSFLREQLPYYPELERSMSPAVVRRIRSFVEYRA